MGLPPRLNGKNTPLPSDQTATCPKCHRKFQVFNIGNRGGSVKRECPYCGYRFGPKGGLLKRLFNNN